MVGKTVSVKNKGKVTGQKNVFVVNHKVVKRIQQECSDKEEGENVAIEKG